MRFSHRARLARALALAAGLAPAMHAQTIRGIVVDRTDRPVAGVVMMLLDSTSRAMTRALSNERGEFRLMVNRAGTYRVSSMRIGYRPSLSQPYALAAGATRTERITLSGIELVLDTLKVVATSACKVDADQSAATFAVWEQARTALLAADLTRASRTITSTTVVHERTLDATGRRTLKQTSALRTEYVAQPWRAASPDSLHRTGFVVREEDNSTTYNAPGLEMLVSDVFLGDHCFHLSSDSARIGIAFEPNRDREHITEITGTIWLDRATAALKTLEFQYVNLPPELSATAGGDMEFARLSNGAWAISRWSVTMPVIQKRLRNASFGGDDFRVIEVQKQGGELVLALRNGDTVFSQSPRTLRGIARDSVSGRALAGARVSIAGTDLSAVADDKGRFGVSGVLPGVYTVQVRTTSLDSVSAIHQAEVEFTDEANAIDLRVPGAAALMTTLCGPAKYSEPGVIAGQVVMRGTNALPADTRILVDWRTPTVAQRGGTVTVSSAHDYREGRTTPQGAFRLCGIPVERDLVVHAISDSGFAEIFTARIAAGARVSRVELTMDRPAGASAVLAGKVLADSTHAPLAGVSVTLADLARTVQTDVNGAFQIAAIPAGTHRFSVRRIGYGAIDTTLTFGAGETIRRELFLPSITELSEVNVTASTLPRSFEENRQMKLGTFMTRGELAKMEGSTTSGMLSQMRGARIIIAKDGRGTYVSSSRRHDCNPGLPCPADYDGLQCFAKVYIDEILMNPGAPTPPYDIRQTLPISQMEGVEFYAGASEVPAKYSGHDVNCGVLVLWTRRSP